ncbi:cation:proton antiporter [Bacillus sp. FJAT-27225]|uniref:Na+/H+ antiporter subunit E n=1 Tax=Bacillus sp. FJAT-27225 TaxID=1743144 RepID=UPI00080C2ABA|nr:Na+/H+ antiporter subunit E [Bacillus sp. FJAT-27225]OCA81489.1 cation:proton antiporter [Bacillus sp. FJAT-27225]
MAIQVLINLFIASLWTGFQDDWSGLTFISGYFAGMVVLFLMRRFLPQTFYIITFINILKLFFVFIQELFTSSYTVIHHIIKPKLNITPGVFTLDTDLETDAEVTLLALLLTLTPGSVVINISEDGKTFLIHALDISESPDAIKNSKVRFENSIKKVTR